MDASLESIKGIPFKTRHTDLFDNLTSIKDYFLLTTDVKGYTREGNVIQKVKAMIPILIPLFATSLKRADSLATAMEARGYQGGNGRSQYRQLKWMNKDSVALLLICVLGGILFLLKS